MCFMEFVIRLKVVKSAVLVIQETGMREVGFFQNAAKPLGGQWSLGEEMTWIFIVTYALFFRSRSAFPSHALILVLCYIHVHSFCRSVFRNKISKAFFQNMNCFLWKCDRQRKCQLYLETEPEKCKKVRTRRASSAQKCTMHKVLKKCSEPKICITVHQSSYLETARDFIKAACKKSENKNQFIILWTYFQEVISRAAGETSNIPHVIVLKRIKPLWYDSHVTKIIPGRKNSP